MVVLGSPAVLRSVDLANPLVTVLLRMVSVTANVVAPSDREMGVARLATTHRLAPRKTGDRPLVLMTTGDLLVKTDHHPRAKRVRLGGRNERRVARRCFRVTEREAVGSSEAISAQKPLTPQNRSCNSRPAPQTLPGMKLPGNKPRDYGDPMTPMIDVVFNLLIFFVVTAVGSAPEKLMPADLPASGAIVSQVDPLEREAWVTDVWLKLSLADQTNTLQVDMNGTVYQDLNLLKSNLRALAEVGPENPVVLDIAPSVQMEQLVDVWDTCIAAGFQSVSFAVDSGKTMPASEPGVK